MIQWVYSVRLFKVNIWKQEIFCIQAESTGYQFNLGHLADHVTHGTRCAVHQDRLPRPGLPEIQEPEIRRHPVQRKLVLAFGRAWLGCW